MNAENTVFTVTFDGDLYCFDQQNGQTLWSQSLGGYTASNQINVENGSVFVGSRGSILNCISEDDGKTLWRFAPNLSSSIASKSAPVFFTLCWKSVYDGRRILRLEGFRWKITLEISLWVYSKLCWNWGLGGCR